ncbi:helix-turn-helix domain-containing protein [Streptomyces sp. NPDC051211]|uniref:helix-turn-helix domain-containing protein n=1 Tax=Streptomyces sp. NPDC051211 TaxID=3154643 RepID=UPI00344E6FB8
MRTSTECGQLAAEMRRLRERTGLSLAALGRRTPYSKSSWERYLNGKQPPPRQAVEALCAVAAEHPARLLALWELADAAWSGRGRPASAPVSVPDSVSVSTSGPASGSASGPASGPVSGVEPAAPCRRRAAVVVGALCVTLLAAAAASTGPALLRGSGPQASPAAESEKPVRNPGCAAAGCAGKDPLRMGCGGAGMVTTVLTGTAPGGRQLELRHGEMCQAVWVRASGLKAGDRVEVSVPGSPAPEELRVTDRDLGRYLATPMTPAAKGPAGARFCLTPGSPAEGGRVCFG